MRVFFKKLTLSFLCCCLIIGVSACRNPPQKATSSNQSDKKSAAVSIAITGAPANWLTILAFEKGFFKKEGLAATAKYFPSGKRALLGMFAGEVDIATTADVPVVKNSLERNDFAIFATLGTTYNDNKVVVRKDKGITSPDKLRGRQVATQGNSAAHFFLHLFLLKNDLATTDIIAKFFPIEDLPELLCNGNVEAIVTRQPFLSQTLEECGNKVIVMEEPGLFVKNFHFVAYKDFIQQNQLTIQKIIQAQLEADQFLRTHQAEAISLLSQKLDISGAQVRQTLAEVDLGISLNQPLLRILADEARWLIDKKSLAKEVPNYLDFIWMDGLKKVHPDAVTIIY